MPVMIQLRCLFALTVMAGSVTVSEDVTPGVWYLHYGQTSFLRVGAVKLHPMEPRNCLTPPNPTPNQSWLNGSVLLCHNTRKDPTEHMLDPNAIHLKNILFWVISYEVNQKMPKCSQPLPILMTFGTHWTCTKFTHAKFQTC